MSVPSCLTKPLSSFARSGRRCSPLFLSISTSVPGSPSAALVSDLIQAMPANPEHVATADYRVICDELPGTEAFVSVCVPSAVRDEGNFQKLGSLPYFYLGRTYSSLRPLERVVPDSLAEVNVSPALMIRIYSRFGVGVAKALAQVTTQGE